MNKREKKPISLFQSFGCAVKGLASAFVSERNIRIHCCAVFYVVIFAELYGISYEQKAILALTIGAVIAAELFNTAIEAVVDIASPEHNKLAGLAKDIAAGGVLVSALAALTVAGIYLLENGQAAVSFFKDFFSDKPYRIAAAAATAAVWLVVIFPPVKKKKEENK